MTTNASGEFCGVCQQWVYPVTVTWTSEQQGTSLTYVRIEVYSCEHVPTRTTRIPWSLMVKP